MTKKEIEKELNKIYKEMTRWPNLNKKLNYKIPPRIIEKRRTIFSMRQILYDIENAKENRDKKKANFLSGLYYMTKYFQ